MCENIESMEKCAKMWKVCKDVGKCAKMWTRLLPAWKLPVEGRMERWRKEGKVEREE